MKGYFNVSVCLFWVVFCRLFVFVIFSFVVVEWFMIFLVVSFYIWMG